MSTIAFPLQDIVDVVVLVQPQAPAIPTFNVGCIIGPSAVIPASERARVYSSNALAAMLADGFTVNSPEYIAAQIYFSQLVPPRKLVVGRQDLTSITGFVINALGTGYAVNDVIGITQGAAAGGALAVLTVNGGGGITGAVLSSPGTGYSVAAGLAVTGGHGVGATVNVTSIGDTPLAAVQAVRSASSLWWACLVTSAVKADHIAIAGFAQASPTPMMYFYTTGDTDALSGAAGNVFSTLKVFAYNRAIGQYSTTQNGAFPNNIYAVAAAMGVAMGLNTGLANSAFTLWGKTEVGVTTEPLTETQVGVIQGNNGNVYLNFANVYTLFTNGKVANGQFMDEVLNIDMLVAGMQFNEMNLFTQNASIPMTDAGETQLIHAVNQACQQAVLRGFLAGGVWQGVQILNLVAGQSVPAGYLAQAAPYSTQLTSDRQARKAMPIYVAIIEAGSAQSLLIGVYPQR